MTLDEQRALAIECGAESDEYISFTDEELAAYTAAVEAKRDDEVSTLKQELAKHQSSKFHPDWSLLEACRDGNKDLQAWFDNLKFDYDKLKQELQTLREQNPVGFTLPTSFNIGGHLFMAPKPNSDNLVPVYAAPVPASEWMSIETAPKDGTMICLGSAATDDFPAISSVGRWNGSEDDGVDYMGQDSGFIDTEYNYYHCGRSFGNPERQYKGYQPTHWMPLPAAPKEQA